MKKRSMQFSPDMAMPEQGPDGLEIVIIAAMSRNGVIGEGGVVPWRLPADLKRFRRLTMGHHVVMGRRTFESIGKELDGRITVVLSRNRDLDVLTSAGIGEEQKEEKKEEVQELSGRCNRGDSGCVLWAGSLNEAMEIAKRRGERKVFVAGGSQVYKKALVEADRLYLTVIDAELSGDAFFPQWDPHEWVFVGCEHHAVDEENPLPFDFREYKRP